MAKMDWTEMAGNAGLGTIRHAATAGVSTPNGGGTFAYAFNSIELTPACVAFFANQTGFAPMAKGGIITGALQRKESGGPLNFSVFLMIGVQGASTSDNAYLLGLEDAEPHRIVLRKGKVLDGLPSAIPGSLGVLSRSIATYPLGTWHHLQLSMVANTNGDVVLSVFRNDLAVNSVATPQWQAITGMPMFIDDATGINSGSAPYTSGRVGWGFQSKDVTRRACVDHVMISRDNTP